MTALTIYMTNIADTTFTTCNQLISTSGSPSTTTTSTKIGTATGYGEVYSQGNTNAWAASGSIGSPSLQGWIYDTSLLNNAMLAGNWTPTLRFSVSTSSIVADIHVRAYSYVLSGFTQIGSDMILSAQTITTSVTTYSFSATSEPLQAMNYLYLDVWLNITSNTTGVNGVVKITLGNSSSQGYTLAQVVTPGYSPTTSTKKDGSSRLRLSGSKKPDGKTRFLLYKGLNASLRLKASKQHLQNAVTRFANAALSPAHDAKVRFVLLSASRQKNGQLRFKMVSGPIVRGAYVRGVQRNVTSQTVYMSSFVSSVLATADTLVTASGSPATATKSVLIGTSTGYGEVNSQGTSSPWGQGTQNILPDGSGYLCASTLFEGSVFVPGAWSANVKMNVNAGSIVADIHVRAYQWHNNNTLLGAYYFIADMILAAQTINTAQTTYVVTANTSTPSNIFQVGDKLYADITLEITSNKTNSGSAKIFNLASTSSTVGTSLVQLITSGYSPPSATNRNANVRFRLNNTRQKYAISRFRVSVNRSLSGITRFLVAGQRYKFGVSRFRQSAVSSGKDGSNRFKLASILQRKDATSRLATQGQRYQSGINRFRLSSVTQFKNATNRFLTRAAKQRDSQTRFLQRTPTQYRNASTRFKALLPSFKNGMTRFLQVSGTQFKSAVSRFKQSGSVVKSAITRLKLSGFLQRNANARFRQSVPKALGASSRLKAQGQVYKLGTNRFRLNSPVRYQDSNTRFRQSVPKALSGISRFRQSVPVLRNAIARFKMISPTIYRMASARFLQSVPIQRSGISRFRQSVPVLRNAIARIKTRVARTDSFSSRFRLNSAVQYHDAISLFKQSGLVVKSASVRLKARFLQLPNASLRIRLSGFVQDSAIVRLLTRKQVQKGAIARLKVSGAKVPSAIIRFLANMFVARYASLRFRQSVPVVHSYDMRLRTWGAPYLSFALRLRQRVNTIRSAVTRFRLSKVVIKSATCRLQTYHFNPRDGHIRFVLRPSTVSPISSATTEILFRDGTVEMVFRS